MHLSEFSPQFLELWPIPNQTERSQSDSSKGQQRPIHGDQHVRPLQPKGGSPQHQGSPIQLHMPAPRRTNPFVWLAAVFCAIFWVVIIISGLAVLTVYLAFRPVSPGFDLSMVTLNAAYIDMGDLLNADMTLLANFTNPNTKVSVDFSYMIINLYYGSTLIASQYIEPFSATKAESWFANIHMVSSQVRLPTVESRRLEKQIETDGIIFDVRGFFRARSNFGSLLRYSYWLHSHCTMIVGGPPDGVLMRSKCKTSH